MNDLKAAYSGFWKWVGILIAGVSVWSWIAKTVRISLSALVSQFVEAYRAVFHPIVEFLFGWLVNLLPFELPIWWPDAAILYGVAGGAVARTYWLFYSSAPNGSAAAGPPIFGRADGHWRPVALVGSFLIWPLGLIALLDEPFIFERSFNGAFRTITILWSYTNRSAAKDNEAYLFNLRMVFLYQLLAVIAVCVALSALNAATST